MNPILLETILVCVGFFLLMAEAFLGGVKKSVFAYAGMVGLVGVFGLTFLVDPNAIDSAAAYSAYYTADGLAIFFKRFVLLATFCVLLMAVEFAPVLRKYLPSSREDAGVGEFYSLPLFACAGMMWLVSAMDFVMIFVSLELVTVSFYVLVAYMRKNTFSLEAGVKYLILGALSTGFIVYGITWIFGVMGTTNLDEIAKMLPNLAPEKGWALLFGVGMVLVAVGFKVGAVPFQFWIPDVYQGAPTPVTAYLSVASKAVGFLVLMRILEVFLGVGFYSERLLAVIVFLAGMTMVVGNLAAVPQTNFKRLLAYSSIAHAGYLLMAVASVASGGAGYAILFYLVVYLLMTMLAFAVMIVVSQVVGGDNISDFNGLGKRNPWLAFAMTIGVLSLAGLPFTAGFFGKFFVFVSALDAGLYWLVGIGAFSVACGFYYYLKVIRAMYWLPVTVGETENVRCRVSLPLAALIVVLVILTLALGVFPSPVFALMP